MRAGVLPRFSHALRQTELRSDFRARAKSDLLLGWVALIQRTWVIGVCTSLGRPRSGQVQTRLHARASGFHRFIQALKQNSNNHKFMIGFKNPSLAGRVFFRLFAQGQTAPIYKQQFVYATL